MAGALESEQESAWVSVGSLAVYTFAPSMHQLTHNNYCDTNSSHFWSIHLDQRSMRLKRRMNLKEVDLHGTIRCTNKIQMQRIPFALYSVKNLWHKEILAKR